MLKNKERNQVFSVFLLSIGLLLSSASVSYVHIQITQTVYAAVAPSFATRGIGDTNIASRNEIIQTVDSSLPISATFNEPMDGTTLNSSTFTVTDRNSNNIPGTVSLDSDNKTATFTPLSPLVYSAEYMATVNTGTKDLAGNPLPVDYSWSFLTPYVIDNQSENISEVSYYNTADNNITSGKDVLTNGTEIVAPSYSYPDPTQQGQQQQINDNVSSSTSSPLKVPEMVETFAIEKSLEPLTSETTTGLAGNLNQSLSTLTPVTSTAGNSISTIEQKGAEAGLTTSQPSDLGTMPALQQQQQDQNNLLPYQEYYQYPPQQLYQNQQYSYPSSNLTNIPDGTGLSTLSLSEDAASVLQEPTQQQQLPPSLLTGIQPSMRASPPETFIISAIDKVYGQNILSGSTVSSQFISLTFAGTDDAGHIMDFQCSYDGQPPYSCASPFTIDNSLVLIPTNIPIVPNSNSHMLLISSVDFLGNIDQTPASFFWSVGSAQETSEAIPITEPTLPTSSTEIPQTEPPFSIPLAEYATQASEYNNNDFTIPGSSNSIPPSSSIIMSPSE